MKKSTVKEKPKSKKIIKAKPQVDEPGEIEGLIGKEQPLFYYGPPPAIKTLYQKTNYDKNFHPQDLLERMRAGDSESFVVASWGITYGKFNDWLEKFSEFAEAYAVGVPAYDAYYKTVLKHSAFGLIKGVREMSLFMLLKSQAGVDDSGAKREYADGTEDGLEFVDDE